MNQKPKYRLLVARRAKRDIDDIITWSIQEFGDDAALRYGALISQALHDIETDPERPGSKERAGLLPGVRTYHLSFSRNRVTTPVVKEPRHFLIYRHRQNNMIELGRVLYDTRDIRRHLPKGYIDIKTS